MLISTNFHMRKGWVFLGRYEEKGLYQILSSGFTLLKKDRGAVEGSSQLDCAQMHCLPVDRGLRNGRCVEAIATCSALQL